MSTLIKAIEKCVTVIKPSPESFSIDKFITRSKKFPIQFPINSIRYENLTKNFNENELKLNITSTYPLIHEKVLALIYNFIEHKQIHGSDIEKSLYKNMDIISFIDRLLKLRCVAFLDVHDSYLLLTKEKGFSGWEKIGTDTETPPLTLEKCLSYDELKLSAFLYVSGPSVFINDGSRHNRGINNLATNDNIEKSGVIIGLIGTRLEKENVMEYQDIMITRNQNKIENGYGPKSNTPKSLLKTIWGDFYQENMLTFDEVDEIYKDRNEKYVKLNTNSYFNNTIFSRRLSFTFDCTLLEANSRAKSLGKMAYLHVVGIGLGVWKISQHQTEVFVVTFLKSVFALRPSLTNISDIHFAYFRDVPEDVLPEFGKFIQIDNHPQGGIKVHLSRREPSSKLVENNYGKLLIETYAWDSNAHPGNEFWLGSLDGSGDPAAACSSQVAELHNAHINSDFICGQNLHIASKFGIKHIGEYSKLVIDSGES